MVLPDAEAEYKHQIIGPYSQNKLIWTNMEPKIYTSLKESICEEATHYYMTAERKTFISLGFEKLFQSGKIYR